MNIARVFPRRNKATPEDEFVFIDTSPPLIGLPKIDEVHISVTFTTDLKKVEWLEKQWRAVGVPVKVGGPALDEAGGEFTPGLYLKKGYVITSRGCPNKCPYCFVPKREGSVLRELEIKEGYDVLDDNLLRCSEEHITKVFDMLSKQSEKPRFTGGLESKALTSELANRFKSLGPKVMYFAYDRKSEFEPLVMAGRVLRDAGFTWNSHVLCCYVLIGYPNDTKNDAIDRIRDTMRAGFVPFAMLYMDENGKRNENWASFQREFCNKALVGKAMNQVILDSGLI